MMKIENRCLFLKYAWPASRSCADISKDYFEHIAKCISEGKVPDEPVEDTFKVARAWCDIRAKQMGKDKIDSSVIRGYFLLDHNKVDKDRPDDCKTHSGSVVGVRGGFATVETSLGRKDYRTDFVKGLREGDTVVVHYDFIVEKLPERMIKELRRTA